jgi:S-DNA-T family DNA segregation ATPase FtsK/SpoIIIE
MASRALISNRPGTRVGPNWRAVLRRSVRRSAELIGGAALFLAMAFLALALASYTQTDPSGSTASGSPVDNWMGLPGAWAAERVLLVFGLPGVLMVPCCSSSPAPVGRGWRREPTWATTGDDDDEGAAPGDPAWWRLALGSWRR